MKDKFYYKDGSISANYDPLKILHRIDGPAIEYTDVMSGKDFSPEAAWQVQVTKFWYIDDKLHRIDGPAEEYANGGKVWWIDGKNYSEREFNLLLKEIRKLPLALRLIDPREWVRKL